MLIIPLIIGIINIKAIMSTPLKIIFFYCCIYICFESVSWYYALHGWQNHFVENTVNYSDVIILGCFYVYILTNPLHKKIVIGIIIIAVITLIISNVFGIKDYNRIDSFAKSFTDVIIIFLSLIFFYQLLNTLEIRNLFQYSYFWISTSLLIYFSGIFFINIFAEYITFNKDESIKFYWHIKEYLTIFHRIFIAIGLWFSTTHQQLNPSSK